MTPVADVLASFFDPSNNGFDGDDFVRIGPIVVLIYVAARWAWKRGGGRRAWLKVRGLVDEEAETYIARIVVDKIDELRDELHTRTETIQPGANTGESLSDNNRLTEWLVEVVGILAARLNLTLADLPPKPDVRHGARTRTSDQPDPHP